MTVGIYWEFLKAQYECKVINKTMYVHLQEDMTLAVNKDISFQLPIKFQVKHGAVLLNTVDKMLVPVSQVFLSDSEERGLVVTCYNRGNQTLYKKAGDLLCILRHVT